MKHQSITTLPPSPEAERRSRMIKYTIAMSIRVLCIVALLFVQGWWLVVFAAGAIFLPYFAVVIANVGSQSRQGEVLRPGSIVRMDGPSEPIGGPAPDAGGASGAGPSPTDTSPTGTSPTGTSPTGTSPTDTTAPDTTAPDTTAPDTTPSDHERGAA